MNVGILTGGGDCPGLNAVIRAVVRKAERHYGTTVFGFHDGWRGILDQRYEELTVERMRGTLLEVERFSELHAITLTCLREGLTSLKMSAESSILTR